MVAQTLALRDAEFGGDVAGGDLGSQFAQGVALLVGVPAGAGLRPMSEFMNFSFVECTRRVEGRPGGSTMKSPPVVRETAVGQRADVDRHGRRRNGYRLRWQVSAPRRAGSRVRHGAALPPHALGTRLPAPSTWSALKTVNVRRHEELLVLLVASRRSRRSWSRLAEDDPAAPVSLFDIGGRFRMLQPRLFHW